MIPIRIPPTHGLLWVLRVRARGWATMGIWIRVMWRGGTMTMRDRDPDLTNPAACGSSEYYECNAVDVAAAAAQPTQLRVAMAGVHDGAARGECGW